MKFTNLTFIAVLLSLSVEAQNYGNDGLLEDTESVLNSADIDVDGRFRRKTDADRLEKMRRNLEQQNRDYAQKQIENERIQQEKKLTKKLQNAFQQGWKKPVSSEEADAVEIKVAAPQKIEAPAPVAEIKAENKEKDFFLTPFVGFTAMNSDLFNLRSGISFGLDAQANVSEQFSVGIAFRMLNSKVNQLPAPFFLQNGQEIDYTGFNVELNGRYTFFRHRIFRPYVGLGIGFNRFSLDYDNQRGGNNGFHNGYNYNYNYNYNPSFQNYRLDQKYSANAMTGSVAVGTVVRFNENIGLNLEGRFQKALGSAFGVNTDNGNGTMNNAYFQPIEAQALRFVGEEAHRANVMAFHAGLSIGF